MKSTRWVVVLCLCALALILGLIAGVGAAHAHHCQTKSCVTLKPQYRACANLKKYVKVARCEIKRAARHYHQPVSAALRVARCESTYQWWLNGHHEGMFQFLWSTWRTTPYRKRSPYVAKWNSLAAMWMWHVGRRGEWQCR